MTTNKFSVELNTFPIDEKDLTTTTTICGKSAQMFKLNDPLVSHPPVKVSVLDDSPAHHPPGKVLSK